MIILQEKHIKYSDWIARERRKLAIEMNRKPGTNCTTENNQALAYDILGMRCECAGYLFFQPVKWHWQIVKDVKNLPDLDNFIDVKGIAQARHRMIVPLNGREDWAYVLVSGHNHPEYEVFGWLWGKEAKKDIYLDNPAGRGESYYIERKFLNSPDTLMEVLRQQQIR
jgi:hypothetical protein